MKFSTLLLAGVSIAALSAAPAFARSAPAIHAASRGGHLVKSHVRDPRASSFTETATFSATISTASDYKVKTEILGDTWYYQASSSTCAFPPKEHWKGLPAKTKYAVITRSKMSGTLGQCPAGTVVVYHDINYELKSMVAAGKSDTVAGTLTAKHWTLPSGATYNLYLNATIEVSITS